MRSVVHYFTAVLYVAGATGLNLLLWRQVAPQVSPMYFAAVMVAAWSGGLGPGLLASLLAGFASVFFFGEERFSLHIGPADPLRLAVFLLVAMLISWLNGARKEAQLRLRQAHGEMEKRVHQRTADLSSANEQLRQEVVARQRSQEELLAYQDRLRDLSAELSLTEQRERRRLAGQLHDGIGQLLSLAQMKLEMAGSLASNGQSQAAAVRETAALIDQVIGQTRTLTWELSPPVLYEMGLRPALEWLIEQMQRRFGLALGLDADQSADIADQELRSLVFDSVRELLRNAVKHAQARHAMVIIRSGATELRITVQDDGVGVDPDVAVRPPADHHSFGLFSIRERLRHYGGGLEIDSTPGRGARFTMVLPAGVATTPATAAKGDTA
jgi:signal transduction histidine kinase